MLKYKSVACLFAVVLHALLFGTLLPAQNEKAVDYLRPLSFAKSDIDLVVHFDRPGNFASRLVQLGLFDIGSKVDESLEDREENRKAMDDMRDFFEKLSNVRHISFVFQEATKQLAIVVCSDDETLFIVNEPGVRDISRAIMNHRLIRTLLCIPDGGEEMDLIVANRSIMMDDNTFTVFATTEAFCQEVVGRLQGVTDARLVDQRLFKRISSAISEKMSPGLFFYVRGQIVERLFLEKDEIAIEKLTDCIPAFGGKIEFYDDHILVNAVGARTVPTNGLAMVYDAFVPLNELTPVAGTPTEMEGFMVDSAKYWETRIKRYDAVYGSGALEKKLAEEMQDGKNGFFYFKDCIPATKGTIFVKWKSRSNEKQHLTLFKLNDREAQLRWFAAIRNANEQIEGVKFVHDENEKFDLWYPDEDSFISYLKPRNSKVAQLDDDEIREKIKQGEFFRMSYAVGREWSCQGDMEMVRDQIRLLEENEGESKGNAMKNLSIELEQKTKIRTRPIMFWYSSSCSYLAPFLFNSPRKLRDQQSEFEKKIKSEKRGIVDGGDIKIGCCSLECAAYQFLQKNVTGTFFEILNEDLHFRAIGIIKL